MFATGIWESVVLRHLLAFQYDMAWIYSSLNPGLGHTLQDKASRGLFIQGRVTLPVQMGHMGWLFLSQFILTFMHKVIHL